MSAFVLKIIACVTMFIDHIGYAIFDGQASWFNYIGRLAFPIFAFQISEGYIHTRNIKKYLTRLLLFALISQIPFMLFDSIITDSFNLNVIFTLLFGLLTIICYDKYHKFVGVCLAFALGIIAQVLNFDYGFYGVCITFLFYVFNSNKLLLSFSFIIATITRYSLLVLKYLDYGSLGIRTAFCYYLPYAICTIASIIIILLYNKKKGPNTRYLLYLFYPLHMLFVYGISFFL